MNLRKIIKEEVDDFENLNWIDKISDKWVPKVGDKFICKPGFKRLSDYDDHPDRYGGAAYIPGKIYTIKSIGPHYIDDDHMVLFTVEDENNNGVFKKAAEPYFEYLEESTSDFDWIKDEELPIIPYIGKKFKLITDNGQDSGRRYQILDYYFEGKYNKDFYVKTILLNPRTLEPETRTFGLTQGQIFSSPIKRSMELINNGNWVFLDKINESQDEDDWSWAKGDVIFYINDIIGKKGTYRENNLGDLEEKYKASIFDFNRGDITLGDIKKESYWWFAELRGNNVILNLKDGGEIDYEIKEVEKYVNLGIWVLYDENGNILNDFSNKNLKESEYYLNKVIKNLSILTEDGKTKPDMEWDFTNIKKDLDKSKQWVKTAEDVKEYLTLLFQKVKNLPKKTKIKILKYVLFSFIGLISLKELNSIAKEVSPEKIEIKLKKVEEETKIKKASDQLLDHLKKEEGIGGKPVLTAYDLGDGAYTIGYGHAVFANPSRGDNGGNYDFLPTYDQIEPGKTKITPKQAEILLKDDIKIAEDALNKILMDWEKEGIKPNINQNMYDAMISMIYNMGIGNFRMSDFIQMVKSGDMKSASQEIKNISSNMFNKYPGLKTRRERESKLFTSQS